MLLKLTTLDADKWRHMDLVDILGLSQGEIASPCRCRTARFPGRLTKKVMKGAFAAGSWFMDWLYVSVKPGAVFAAAFPQLIPRRHCPKDYGFG